MPPVNKEETEMREYVALIRKEENTDYWVDIPDLPGCVSSGETKEDAIANFQEALDIHMDTMREDNLEFPEARPLANVLEAEKDEYLEAYVIEIDTGKSIP